MRPSRRIRFARAARALARDARGVSLIEFGMLVPIIAVFMLGAVDLARALATKFAIEQAAQRTIEIAALGTPRADYNFLQAEAVAASGAPTANVVVTQRRECNGTLQTPFAAVCPVGQTTRRYVTITITKDYMPMFTWIPFVGRVGNQPNGARRFTADAGVRVQ